MARLEPTTNSALREAAGPGESHDWQRAVFVPAQGHDKSVSWYLFPPFVFCLIK